MHNTVDRVSRLPVVYHLRRSRFDSAFAGGEYGGYRRIIFATYDAAAAPKSLPLGYDNPEAATMYRDRVKQVFPSDYPMILWLSKALDDGAGKLFDLGGHVGISYYADQPLLRYPPELSWRVCDVPAVVQAGRRLAAHRDQFIHWTSPSGSKKRRTLTCCLRRAASNIWKIGWRSVWVS